MSKKESSWLQGPRRGWGWGSFSPPTFLAVDVRTLNVQREIFKVLMKDGEFICFDDILAKIKQLSEAVKCMITEIITLRKLLLVNPATRGILFFCSETENVATLNDDTNKI